MNLRCFYVPQERRAQRVQCVQQFVCVNGSSDGKSLPCFISSAYLKVENWFRKDKTDSEKVKLVFHVSIDEILVPPELRNFEQSELFIWYHSEYTKHTTNTQPWIMSGKLIRITMELWYFTLVLQSSHSIVWIAGWRTKMCVVFMRFMCVWRLTRHAFDWYA